jgi:hypothetical protein
MRHRARLRKLSQRAERARVYTPEEIACFVRQLLGSESHAPVPFFAVRQLMEEEEDDN